MWYGGFRVRVVGVFTCLRVCVLITLAPGSFVRLMTIPDKVGTGLDRHVKEQNWRAL